MRSVPMPSALAVIRGLERNGDVAHRGEVVDFVRLDLLDDADQVGGVGQISDTVELSVVVCGSGKVVDAVSVGGESGV